MPASLSDAAEPQRSAHRLQGTGRMLIHRRFRTPNPEGLAPADVRTPRPLLAAHSHPAQASDLKLWRLEASARRRPKRGPVDAQRLAMSTPTVRATASRLAATPDLS